MNRRRYFLIPLLCLLASPFALGDEFTYVDDEGAKQTIQAAILCQAGGYQYLERSDGQVQPVPTAAILERKNTGDPTPFTPEQLAARLSEIFTPTLTRTEIQGDAVVAMVLAAPIEKGAEGRASLFIKKAARFMNNVDGVFRKYAESMQFPLRELKYPLVMVIFESERDFDEYAEAATGGNSLSVSSIIGFYSPMTNWLAVRMSSCDSFELPLHEAIHQQMFNRVQQRFGPCPKWFSEGIATGFEGNGERIDSNPVKVNSRYARQAMRLPPGTQWGDIAGNDGSYSADVLAGDAYTLAWCLHWQLATQHKEKYQKYVQALSQRAPMQDVTDEEEAALFRSTFGLTMNELQAKFPQALQLAARKQKVTITDPPPGNITSQKAMGQYSIDAVRNLSQGGQLQAGGFLKNISPLRPMTFYVTLETDGGLYADWLVPELKPNQKQQLEKQVVIKQISSDRPAGDSSVFRIFVRSAPSTSDEAASWRAGQVPGPVTAN